MKRNPDTSKTWRLRSLLLTVPLLILPACAQRPQVPVSLPTLPAKPSVNMPPMPSEVSTSVQQSLSELEKQRQARVLRLTPSMPHGPTTPSSKTD